MPDAFAGPHGNALFVDGSGYAAVNTLCAPFTQSFTVELWFRPSSTHVDPDSASVFGLNDATGNANLSLLMWNWTTNHFVYFDDYFTSNVEYDILYPPDEWHFFALSYGTGQGALYGDGILTSDIVTTRIVNACKLALGQEWDGGATSDFVVGHIDEVSVWTRAKTSDEIIADMHANATGNEPELAAYYRFDTDGVDDSGNGNTAVLVGGATIVPAP